MTIFPRALVTATSLLWMFAATTDVGAQPGGQIIVSPGDAQGVNAPPAVGVGVTAPGRPGQPGQSGGSGGSGGHGGASAPVCTYSPAGMDPSAMFDQFGQFHNGTIGGQTSNSGPTVAYVKTCNGVVSGWVTGPAGATPDGADVVVLPTPEQLARQAYQQMQMPLPVPRRSPDLRLPDGRPATVVGEHTWIWTEKGVWSPQSKRATAGPVWAEVTATPTRLSFQPGTSAPLSCSGPGTPYDRAHGVHAASPDCDYVFSRSSHGAPGDQITATYGITWRLTWTGSTGIAPAAGALPDMISRASATFAVAEVQAFNR